MDDYAMPLVLGLDVCSLTMTLVNIASASGSEQQLAVQVEAALRTVAHLEVERVADTVIARSRTGSDEHVVVAAHLDTAPGEPLAYTELGELYGPGACDAKGALACVLKVAAAGGFRRDVSFVLHAGGRDGLRGLTLPPADIVLLAEPTACAVSGVLDHPLAHRLVELSDVPPAPGAGQAHGLDTLAALATPAVAFGPGDPSVGGKPGEFVPTAQLARAEFVLRQWLTAPS